ncbi:MAG: hypothetical protein LBI10_02670 [Deltaproteobacteria bacterium]|nr:hypothetical protein [Deltaproteobacteria bacterium]
MSKQVTSPLSGTGRFRAEKSQALVSEEVWRTPEDRRRLKWPRRPKK